VCCKHMYGFINAKMSHRMCNKCILFHFFVSKIVLMLQVFNLFTSQCSKKYNGNMWYDLEYFNEGKVFKNID